MQMSGIEGVVVLYHPEISVVDHILSYVNSLDYLYVIDNSIHINQAVVNSINAIPQCRYISNQGNSGMASALNQGAKLAIAHNATWLLTMDQDSNFENNDIIKLIEYAQQQNHQHIGIVSPFHQTEISVEPVNEVDEVISIMTSGNLISLFAYQAIGGFDEQYFIDAVDWDYCLRLNMLNFKVLRVNTIRLAHNLGSASQHTSVTGKQITALNYNKIRRYYITRNKLIIIFKYWRHYPKFCYSVFKSLFRDLRHVLLYESEKSGKLRFMLKGIRDYLLGRTGKLKTPVKG